MRAPDLVAAPGGPVAPAAGYRLHEVSKVFLSGDRAVTAVDGVDLDITPGSFTCIVGPSGCGKSTLLRILGGLERSTVGSVVAPASRPGVPSAAFVFQDHGVFPWFTVLENVAFGLQMAGVGRAERTEAARRWLQRVGLLDFADSYPHQLSGGMRQRTAIARAFATSSPSLLMDEPLGALDAQTRRLMQELLLELWEQERRTVVMVTHAIEEALLLGDRIICMSARPGRIKADLAVPFPRPRDVAIEGTAPFAELKHEIWESLRDEVRKSEELS